MMENKCPLCGREMNINHISCDRHHLIPKSYGGKDWEYIHRICHTKIHSVFTEKEMYKYYNTWDAIKSSPEVQKFIKWVLSKHIEFMDKNKDTKNRNSKRRKKR